MRLINVRDLWDLRLEEFSDSDLPTYAILSHTWGNQEVSLAEFQSLTARRKEGYRKIVLTCEQAHRDGIPFVWIDTCCIDKTSSSELSEAINSMFRWYQLASTCYAYLSDVTLEDCQEKFHSSRWFRRGWTLQELIAPRHLTFFDRDWQSLGTKNDRCEEVAGITGIPKLVLCDSDLLESCCAAQRMSWASNRETTRKEDTAYALLGIFGVNMPLLYGEGAKAFVRLQEEIIKGSPDQSIFAWGLSLEVESTSPVYRQVKRQLHGVPGGVLARSPNDFRHSGRLQYGMPSVFPYTMTNHGLQIHIPLVPVHPPEDEVHFTPMQSVCWIGLLNCNAGSKSGLVGILLVPQSGNSTDLCTRAQYGDLQNHTIIVDAKVAIHAIMKSVTITQDLNHSFLLGPVTEMEHHIVINYDRIKWMGYKIKDVSSVRNQQWTHDYVRAWDPVESVLSVGHHVHSDELFVFNLISIHDSTEFSLLITGLSEHLTEHVLAVTWNASLSSDAVSEQLSLYFTVGASSEKVVVSSDGEEWEIIPVIAGKQVLDHRIFVVDLTLKYISN
jgi:hypothetical protein